MANIIEVQNLTIKFGERVIIKNSSFSIEQGEFIYLIGKTGSGKSSLLKTLYADLPLEEGEVTIVDYSLTEIRRKDIPYLRRKIGVIFQDFQLLMDRTIEENLFFVMRSVGLRRKDKMKRRLEYVLNKVGLTDIEEKYPHQLSGGEQQRVAIARALINDPLVLIADEPTGNLDPNVANEILDLFIKINAAGTSVLMATHHHSFLKRSPARVLFCDEQEVKSVSKEEVLRKLD